MNKQIEEMVGVMAASNNPFVDVPIEIMPRVAEALYNAGYRKVPECAIILTKEEYDKLGLFEETVQEYKSGNGQLVLVKEQKTLKKYPTDIADFIRKETAKEIYKKAEFVVNATSHLIGGKKYLYLGALKEIVNRLYGVEVDL